LPAGRIKLKIKVILEPSEEGGYTVYAPSLPGCISEGDSEAEALTNIKEAIELYLEPVDDELFVSDSHLVKEVAL
jgi:predicted RNase H-like HicB family nuclease